MIKSIGVCLPDGTDPYDNLALEYGLLHAVRPGECILSLWRNRKAVVVGRNQDLALECRLEALAADGGCPARRLSGGGAVFHDLGNLNFSFLVREPDAAVGRQLAVIIEALASFGLHAERNGRNDLTIGGQKFSGSAFFREGVLHCHHGTLLVCTDEDAMARYLTPDTRKLRSKGIHSVRSRVVNLQTLCPALNIQNLRNALVSAFGQVYGLPPKPFSMERLDTSMIRAKSAELSSPEWLYGRKKAGLCRSGQEWFPWGVAELGIGIKRGAVDQVILYTDALDETLPQRLNALLQGLPWNKKKLTEAIRAETFEPGIADDLCRLLDRCFEQDKKRRETNEAL